MSDPRQINVGGVQTAALMEVLRDNYDGGDVFLTQNPGGHLIVAFAQVAVDIDVDGDTEAI